MTDDQPTVPGSSSWPHDDSEYAPTQLPGQKSADDHPTPPSLQDIRASPPPPPAAPPFRPSSGPSSQAGSDKTVLMRAEPEPQIPLAWLAIVEGPGGKRGTVLALKTETIVGRTSGDYLLSGDSTISSQHIRIRLEAPEAASADDAAETTFVLYDQASSNGTFVGNKQNYRDDESRVYRRELQDGDYVLVGNTTLVFKQVA
ncbi:MAG: FHA domain-containing protein [Thermoflexales bacterium]|nr:FHA domain-containing protein [Thermoflexales bacterium]